MNPLVSVIIPNYNHARFLQQRIDSVLKQKFQDFELILLDDCSSDGSLDILLSYKDNPKVSQLVINETNSGSPFIQWDKGIRLAKGKWIWIAESDDWAEPDFLNQLIQAIKKRNDVVVAYSNSILEYPGISENPGHNSSCIDYDGILFIKSKMLFDNAIYNASSAIFSKEAYLSISKEYRDFKVVGDKLLWILMCEKGHVIHCHEPLNHFRRHEKSTSLLAEKSGVLFEEEYRIFQRISKHSYFTTNDRINMVNYYLKWITKTNFDCQDQKEKLYQLWKKELPSRLVIFLYKKFKIIKTYIRCNFQ